MSIAAQPNSTPLPADTPAPAQDQAKSTLRWLGKSIWAMGDQALMSATNFITMVLAARALGPESFGSFTLVYSALLLFNTAQNGLVAQPHNVLAATRKGDDYRRYTTAAAFAQCLLAAFFALLSLAAAAIAHALGSSLTGLLLALAVTTPAWQLQEFIRRVLYTENRAFDAFLNDLISYGLQALAITVCFWHGQLTGQFILYILAITSGLAILLGIWQLRRSLIRSLDTSALRENWNFGKWLAGAEILVWFCTVHMYQYIVAAIVGQAAAGILKAVQTLFGPMRVFSYFLGTVLPIRFSRALQSGGPAQVHAQLLGIYTIVGPMLAAYCLTAALFAKPIMHFLYGDKYAGGEIALVLYSIAAFVAYFQMVLISALTAARATRKVFVGYLVGGIGNVLFGWLLTFHFHIVGTILSMILVNLLVFALFAYFYRITSRSAPSGPDQSPPPAT